MAVTLGDLGGGLSVAIGQARCSSSTWTLQEQAGDTCESILSSKVEERGHVRMVGLCSGYVSAMINCGKKFPLIKATLRLKVYMSCCIMSSYSTRNSHDNDTVSL